MGANGRIKGITLTIGGDTQGLEKALSSVNKNIKTTQSELKDVERLLKLDPANTELLAQKQRLLATTIGETKEKLWALKEAGEQAADALAKGEISQSQYDALQREIVETENTLKGLEEQAGATDEAIEGLGDQVEDSAKAFNQISATGEKIKNVGATVEEVGKKVMPVSLAVGGLGAVSVKTAADFDSAMSKVAAVSGATGEDLEQLRNTAREMGANTKFSATEAAEAMNYMAMAGWETTDMLNGIEGVMNLAAASGEDLATTSDIVTDALTAFGLTAEDSGHFADMLAAASSKANTNVGMMGETFKYCAPVAGALGFTAEDTAEAIGLMANSGIKASQAGTAMRSIMTSLAGEVILTGESIGNLTIQTKNADGSMKDLGQILKECRFAFAQMSESEQEANAEALVGKNAMSGFLAVMNAAPEDIDKLRNAIDNCDGSAENMAAIMQDNLNGQITTLKSKLSELAIAFGEILMPAIRAAVDMVGGLIDWLNSLSPVMKTIVAVIGVVVASLGPVLVVAGKIIWSVGQVMTIIPGIITALNSVKTVIAAVKTGMAALNATMLANPIVLVVAAIAALVAAFIYFWNTSEEFRQFWIDLWESIKEAVAVAVEAIKEFFNGIIDFFKNNWQGILLFIVNPFAGAFKLLWDNCEDFRQFWIDLWDTIKTTAQSIWQGIKDFFASIWNGIKSTAQSIWGGIKDFFASIWNGIKSTAQSVWGGIKDFFASTWEGIKSTAQSIWGGIKDFFASTWEGIKTTAGTAWNGIKNSADSIWGGIKSGITSIAQGLGNNVAAHMNNLKSRIGGIWNQISQSTTATWNSLVAGVQSALGSLAPRVREGFQETIEFITTLPGKAIEWGRDFVVGLINGIKEKINAVLEPIREIGKKIREFLHFSRPDKGPLRDYETWMPDFMKGLADGIKNNQGLVTDAVNNLAKNMSIQGEVAIAGTTDSAGTNGLSEMLAVMKQYLPYLAENREVVLDTGETIGALGVRMNDEFHRIDIREKGR